MGGKPMPLPRSRLSRLALFLLFAAFLTPLSRSTLNAPSVHPPQTPLALTSAQQGQVRDFAARVLQKAGKADCKPRDCTILVPNFTLASGATSRIGMQLADQVSIELAAQQNAIKIIDRSSLQSFLGQERIPSNLFNDEKAICWLGKQLGANALLRGTTEDRGGPLRVQASLLSCHKNKAGPVEEFSFSDSDPRPELTPLEPFPGALSSPSASSAPFVTNAAEGGVSAPRCSHCPQPDYTDPAREAKFNGTALLDVTVSAEGRTADARVFRGLPFGLNNKALKAVRQWKFQPATRNGQPMPVQLKIEISFRLY
jgi:TonB family protein